MGKKNNKGGPKPQQSYMDQQKQRLGVGFISKLTADDIKKNALRIFKDLAVGNMPPAEAVQYFSVYDFVYNLKVAADENLNYRQYVYYGLCNNPVMQYDQQAQKVAAEIADQINTYMSIDAHLNNILNDITMNNGVYVEFYLNQMVADIRWRKNTFNGFFVTINTNDSRSKRIRQERRQIHNDQRTNNKNERDFFNKHP